MLFLSVYFYFLIFFFLTAGCGFESLILPAPSGSRLPAARVEFIDDTEDLIRENELESMKY